MGMYGDEPFKVGQLVEARSFMKGYRGAWFRCKILDIKKRDGYTCYELNYIDFPDEKDKPVRLYQLPPGQKRTGERVLMVRPPFPCIYHDSQLPLNNENSEPIVIVKAMWKVGDLVDWWTDGCFWSGKLTEILGNEEARIELTPPPKGEGKLYIASLCDLRPSLDWSLENGWKLPTPEDGANYIQCAQLVHPVNQCNTLALEKPAQAEGTVDGEACRISSAPALCAHGDTKPLPASEKNETCQASGMLEESESSPKEVMVSQEENTNSVSGLSLMEDSSDSSSPLKKLRTSFAIPLNSIQSDTLEAAIVDLEELANKIRWLKSMLKRSSLSNAVDTSWTFVEHRGPSVR